MKRKDGGSVVDDNAQPPVQIGYNKTHNLLHILHTRTCGRISRDDCDDNDNAHEDHEDQIEEVLHVWDLRFGNLERACRGAEAATRICFLQSAEGRYREAVNGTDHRHGVTTNNKNGSSQGGGNTAGAPADMPNLYIEKDGHDTQLHSLSTARLSLAAHHLWGLNIELDASVERYVGASSRRAVWPGIVSEIDGSITLLSCAMNKTLFYQDAAHVVRQSIELVQLSSKLVDGGGEARNLGSDVAAFYAVTLPSEYRGIHLPPLAAYAAAWQDRRRQPSERSAAHTLLCAAADARHAKPSDNAGETAHDAMETIAEAIAFARAVDEAQKQTRSRIAIGLHRLVRCIPKSPGAAAADILAESYVDAIQNLEVLLDDVLHLLDELQIADSSSPTSFNGVASTAAGSSSATMVSGAGVPMSPSSSSISPGISKQRHNHHRHQQSQSEQQQQQQQQQQDAHVRSLVLSSPRRQNSNGITSPDGTHALSPTRASSSTLASADIYDDDSSHHHVLTAALVEEAIASRESLAKLLFRIARNDPLLFLGNLRSRLRHAGSRESLQTMLTALMCLNRLLQNHHDVMASYLDNIVAVLMATMASPSASRRRFLSPAVCAAAYELDQREPCMAFHAGTCKLAYGLRTSPDLAMYDVATGQFHKALELPGDAQLRHLAGYVHVFIDGKGEHVAALARTTPRRNSGNSAALPTATTAAPIPSRDFVLCCWSLVANKQWGSLFGTILDGDRVACKWFQHIRVKEYVPGDVMSLVWPPGAEAISVRRNDEVVQLVTLD